jgi:DNA-binding PadR family transcriptional regulator
VLDDCRVPEALQSTVWVRIKDLNNFDAEFDSTVRAIYEHRDKPELGSAPTYTQSAVDLIPNLTGVDTLVFKLSCEKATQQGYEWIQPEDIWERANPLGISEDDFYETLEILHSRGFIEGHKYADGTDRIRRFRITLIGFDQYARVYIRDYGTVFKSVALRIINHDEKDTIQVSSSLYQPLMVINHIVEVFENRGWVGVNRIATGDNNLSIYHVYPEFKRWLRTI